MAYFKLEKPVEVKCYPFDFHSHFAGILPLESDIKWSGNDGYPKDNPIIKKGDEISIIGMIFNKVKEEKKFKSKDSDKAKAKDKEARIEAHYRLFIMILQLIIRENPFNTTKTGDYQRGECAAENIYIACCLLLRNQGLTTDYEIDKPDIYQIALNLLSTKNAPAKNEKNKHIVAYFNRKILSANKYTPFDDAYWARGAIRDNKDFQSLFDEMSLCHLYASGIRYAQIAASAKKESMARQDKCFEKFNGKNSTSYKLLAQSQHVYSSKNEFKKQLDEIKELFKDQSAYKNLVGIDLLAPENKTGLYKEFFDFLNEQNNRAIFTSYIGENGRPCKKIIIHIHCGEGGGDSENNRSLSGYFLSHAHTPEPQRFYHFLAEYAEKCYRNTLSRQAAREREQENLGKKTTKDYSEISSLFDELFYTNNLIFDGLQLHRFDINSQLSRDIVAYNGKTNIIHLCDSLDSKQENDKSYYQLLCVHETPYSFRIGHAYYDRNYVTSKFPELYYDTNLGSNFITGASGLFDSSQIYRLNNGFRHLNGQIDTDIIKEAMDAVAYMGVERLNREQMALFSNDDLVDTESGISDENLEILGIRKIEKGAVQKFLKDYWGNEFSGDLKRNRHLLLALVANWRSYMFGADGQGVEHSDVETESARMALMLAYQLGDIFGDEIPAKLIEDIVLLFNSLSAIYWEDTIGSCKPSTGKVYKIECFEGFTSPGSVIQVKAGRKIP
jgi:hypothetical protein